MKRLWPGWLLCVLTAGLFAYMFFVDVPAISAMLGGMALPDAVVLGYGNAEARAMYDAFAADFTAAKSRSSSGSRSNTVLSGASTSLLRLPQPWNSIEPICTQASMPGVSSIKR